MLTTKFARAAELMASAREDVQAFRHFPVAHRRKLWNTNLLERVNEEIKRRTRVVGIFPNDAANGLRPTASTPVWSEPCC